MCCIIESPKKNKKTFKMLDICVYVRDVFLKKRKMHVPGCKYQCTCVLCVHSSILIPTFTSYAALWMKVLSAWSWDVITLTGAIERSIRIMAVWAWATELSCLAFINIWKMQMKSWALIKDKHDMIVKWRSPHNWNTDLHRHISTLKWVKMILKVKLMIYLHTNRNCGVSSPTHYI